MRQSAFLVPLTVAAGAFALAASFPTADPDTYWHLASGAWMLEHRAILRADVFSSTVSGQPYALGEWLGEVVLALVFSADGWAGIAVFRGLLIGVTAFFLVRLSRRRGAPPVAALLVVVWAIAFSRTRWIDRPAIYTLVLFPIVLDLLFRAREGSTRSLVAIPPLLLLWANLHGGYVIGLALVLAFAIEAAAIRRRELWPLLATLGASVVLTLLDPQTFGLAGAAAHAFAPPRFISEEAPPDLLDPAGLLFAAFVLSTFAVALVHGGELLDLLLLIPLLWLGLSAQRHLAFFTFAATPFIAAGAARAYARLRPRGTAIRPPPRGLSVALAVTSLVLAAASVRAAPVAPDEHGYPTGAVAALKTGSGTLLNEYDWGGFLIYRVPERKVFVDGRLFPFYPQVLSEYRDLIELRPRWRELLAKYDVREVILMPSKPLAVALREEGWTVRAEDPTFVLLAKP